MGGMRGGERGRKTGGTRESFDRGGKRKEKEGGGRRDGALAFPLAGESMEDWAQQVSCVRSLGSGIHFLFS